MRSEGALSAREIEEAFVGSLEPVPLRFAYRIGLFLVAVATGVPVFGYLGLIALCAFAVYLHASENTFLLTGHQGLFAGVIGYGGPLIIGSVLVFFMVKPLLAPRHRPPPRVTLSPAEAPVLHPLIERVRSAVGAPRPRLVQVDCTVNASVGLARGLWSMFSNDVVLTIGVPLLYGFSTRQLAGVLAHELGHFAQGSSMRLAYLIRAINAWFARVVFERDSWDDGLDRAARESGWLIGVQLHAARFLVWLTRQLLRGLMLAGHATGAFMLRQMEYDADRYGARLAGSDEFARTALRLRLLTVAHGRALGDLEDSWARRRVYDDLPGLTAALAERLPPDAVAAI